MDAKRYHALLELPTGFPITREGWSHEKLTDLRAKPLLEKMAADMKAEKLTGAMFFKEFLMKPLMEVHGRRRQIPVAPGRLAR